MDLETSPDLPGGVADPLRQQQLGCADRPGGQHDRTGPHLVGAGLRVAPHAHGPSGLDDHLLDLGPRPHDAAGRGGAGQLRHVRRLLGVDLAAAGTGAAANDGAGVALDRAVGRSQRLGSGAAERGVAPGRVGIHRRHHQVALERLELALQLRRPGDAVVVTPTGQHVGRGAQAGARVDDRRAADAASQRQRDRRQSLADRESTVAIETGHRAQWVRGVTGRVVVLAGLEHDHRQPCLGQHPRGGRSAGARADDRDVAALDPCRRNHRAGVERRGGAERS